ncbi:unnamed protein product [Echinostoma caproni]|uniref:Glutamic acid-rich protein n=1 Tax=Echinostoma caproni TaxID=27848 RepID=A0A183AHV5_9TREM|nr:unnamed protein product [Echinostoma caproni]
MASSAMHRATELLSSVRTRLESPGPVRQVHVPQRRSSSADRANININNAEMNSYETCSMQTTSTSSSAHSGFLNFALPTTVNSDDPLPLPACRLGAFQAEWLGGTNATWRLVTQIATMSPLAQVNGTEPNLKSLIRVNKALKKEQTFLKAKLDILYDELAKRTALVHNHERQLEKLRNQVRQRMPDHPVEAMRSNMRRELEQKLESTRMKIIGTDSVNPRSEDKIQHKVKKTPSSVSESRSTLSDSTRSQDDSVSQKTTEEESEFERSGPKGEQVKEDREPKGWSNGTNETSVTSNQQTDKILHHQQDSSSDNSNVSIIDEETEAQNTTGDESNTITTRVSDGGAIHDEEDVDEESEQTSRIAAADTDQEDVEEEEEVDDEVEEEEEEEEEVEEENTLEEEEEEEEEELSKTDESSKTEGRISTRPRVVQFGKVSRR